MPPGNASSDFLANLMIDRWDKAVLAKADGFTGVPPVPHVIQAAQTVRRTV